MDVFNYCWVTLVTEAKKCNILLDLNACKVTNSNDECFNKPINRIAYLYKFGTFNILFLQRCLTEFSRKTPGALQILDKLCSTKHLKICSISTGPGIDIIGFLYSLNSLGKPLKGPLDLKLIHKCASWGNTVPIMTNAEIVGLPASSTCKLTQCDILKNLSSKAKSYLKDTDVLLMFQPFTSVKATKSIISHVIKTILVLLKPGALVFFISDKEKSAYFTKLHTCGSFLYGPTFIHLENVPCNEKVVEIVGTKPVCSGSAYFAVWQKSVVDEREKSAPLEKERNNVDTVPTCIMQLPTGKASTTMLEGTVHNLLNLNKNFQIGQSFQNEHLVSRNSYKIPNMNNDHPKFASGTSSQLNVVSDSLTDPIFGVPSETLLMSKQNDTSDNVSRPDDSKHLLNSLLSSFNSLLSTVENYVSEQDPHKHSQKSGQYCKNFPPSNYQKICIQKNNRSCPSRVCCHSVCPHCDVLHSPHALACSQHFCDDSLLSQCNNCRCQSIALQDKPCLVIPTNCLRKDTLTQILSIVNKTNK